MRICEFWFVFSQTKIFDQTIQRNLEPELNLLRDTIEKHKIDNTTAQMYIMETLYYMKGNISDVLLINVEDIRTKVLFQFYLFFVIFLHRKLSDIYFNDVGIYDYSY